MRRRERLERGDGCRDPDIAGAGPHARPERELRAARRVAAIAARQNKPAMLRLAVDGGGCAGFSYKFGLADAVEADDTIAETDGVKLVVDPMSLELVQGSAVDFVEDLGGSAFKVINPNAASGRGCGSSFSV